MVITYTNDVASLSPEQMTGFFAGWTNHPDSKMHLEILRRSYAVWLALDDDRCVGFINALSDGIFSAYIPLLEVLPKYQRQGIGTELMRRMTETLSGMYAIDIVCDQSMVSFYADRGFRREAGMVKRNSANQGATNQHT